jgi:hypothetical protein
MHDRINEDEFGLHAVENSKRETAHQGSPNAVMKDRILVGMI